MTELLRTNDLVRLSFLTALLRDGGIEAVVLDGHMSLAEGSISAIPRRLAVPAGDFERARRILIEAGEERGLA
jgi:Putative prokaryotic signal transducing protein